MGRGRRRRSRRADRGPEPDVAESNPFEYSERTPATTPDSAASSSSTGACEPLTAVSGAAEVPNVVHQLWLGGGKFMFAKLLSVLSVRYALQPDRHYIHYDREPNDSADWNCACRLAKCVKTPRPAIVFGTRLESAVDKTDRYASDRRRRCANAQLEMMKIGALEAEGGIYLDLDAFAMASLDGWRQCAAGRAVVGSTLVGQAVSDDGARRQLDTGVVLASPHSEFVRRWRESYRRYRPDSDFEFGLCNQTTSLASAGPSLVHAAADLGPLPRYASRAGYDRHIATLPLVHLSQFRHPWRLHDVMTARHLERVWERVAPLVNRSGATDLTRTDPLVRRCLQTVAGACWAKPGKRCGIYGARQ